MKKEFLEVGKIVSTHGVRGEVKVMPWADTPEFLLGFRTFYLGGNALKASSVRVQKSCVLIKFDGIDDLDAAAKLREKVLCIKREDAKLDSGVVFIEDLIGLAVFADGKRIGTLTEVLSRPGNDVYIVKGEKEYLIPSVPEYVLERNIEAGFINVKLIEGMASDEI